MRGGGEFRAAMQPTALAVPTALSPLAQLAAGLPEAQQRQYKNFVQDPSKHVMVIGEMGRLAPEDADPYGDIDVSPNKKADMLRRCGCKITRVAHGDRDEIFMSPGVRWIFFRDVASRSLFSTRSRLVEISQQLSQLTIEDAQRAQCPPDFVYRWYDAYGAGAAFLAKLHEQQLRIEQDDRYLSAQFAPLFGGVSVLRDAPLASSFEDDVDDLYARLGQSAIEAWETHFGKTYAREQAECLGRWAEEKLQWRALQSMRFFVGLEDRTCPPALLIGHALFRAQIELGFGPEMYATDVGRTIYTPLAGDEGDGRGDAGAALTGIARAVVQRILLAGSDMLPETRDVRRAAKLFPGLGRRFPVMKPVKAIAIASDEAAAWAGRTPHSRAVGVVDVRGVNQHQMRYVPAVEGLFGSRLAADRAHEALAEDGSSAEG